MPSILVDNWMLHQATSSLNSFYLLDRAFTDIIEAIVLWDDIKYIDGKSTFWQCILRDLGHEDIITPVELPEVSECESIAESLYYEKFSSTYSSIVAQRAIEYFLISNLVQMNYLPVYDRASFLSKNNFVSGFCKRQDILYFLEKNILEFYSEINNLIGPKISFKIPLLAHYVIQNTEATKDYIGTALQIKNSREVRQFRRWMDNFENSVNSGNIAEINYVLSLIPQIISDINKIPAQFSTVIELGLSPSLSFPVHWKRKKSKNINLNFLRTLANYAFKNRRQDPIYNIKLKIIANIPPNLGEPSRNKVSVIKLYQGKVTYLGKRGRDNFLVQYANKYFLINTAYKTACEISNEKMEYLHGYSNNPKPTKEQKFIAKELLNDLVQTEGNH